MSYPTHEIQGPIDSLSELITQNTATFTAAGLTPANIKTGLAAQGTIICACGKKRWSNSPAPQGC